MIEGGRKRKRENKMRNRKGGKKMPKSREK